jgi:hypothetical protein
MFGRALMAAAAVVAIAISTGTLLGGFDEAEAGKPELVIGDISITDDPDCVVTVNWSGLKGGRDLGIGTRLLDESMDTIDNGTIATTARYDAGQIVHNHGDAVGVAYVVVTFEEQRAEPVSVRVPTTCN